MINEEQMKYTIYIFKCLQTGTHHIGVTRDLSAALSKLREGGPGQRLVSPELLHVEQHEDQERAHRRLQAIRRGWQPDSHWPASLMGNAPTVAAALIGLTSLH